MLVFICIIKQIETMELAQTNMMKSWRPFAKKTKGLSTNTLESVVYGLALYDMKNIYHHICIGTEIELKRDAEHELDYYAVAIYLKGFKLGYLPASQSRVIGRYLDRGFVLSARVVDFSKKKYLPIDALKIQINY